MRYIPLLWLVVVGGLLAPTYAQCPPNRPNPNLGGNRTVCVNQVVSLSSGDNDAQHLWTVNGEIVRQDPNDPNSPPYNQPTYNFSPPGPGSYRITVATYYAGCPDTLQDAINIIVDPLPQAPNLGPDQEVCASTGSITLNATVPGATTYIWLANGVQVGTQSQYTHNLRPGRDTIVARAVFNNACTGGRNDTLSDTLHLTIAPVPQAPNLGPDRELCARVGSITLEAPAGATRYIWIVNRNELSNQTGRRYTHTLRAGRDTIVARAVFNNACTGGRNDTLSDTLHLTISPLPAAEITRRGEPIPNGETIQIGSNTVTTVRDTFRAASQVQGNTYRWELYNPQATQPSRTAVGEEFIHTFFVRGEHMLVLKSINGACVEQDTIYINVNLRQGGTGLADVGSAFFSVYPNPSTGTFTLQAPAGTYKLSLQDMTGRLLYTETFQGEQREVRLSLPAGIYLLTLEGPTQRGTLPLWITE
ncbi:MAG: T9SS type A sorting domain-containing protein [Bacteroidia bacterium]|nr:T9SS type A sorting domain-containing protein [Bacteroidia bacterium]